MPGKRPLTECFSYGQISTAVRRLARRLMQAELRGHYQRLLDTPFTTAQPWEITLGGLRKPDEQGKPQAALNPTL